MGLHADQYPASRQAFDAINRAVENGWLSDSIINPLTTTAGLEAAVAGGSGHADQYPARARLAGQIDIAVVDGTLTNTNVAAADTVAGIRALNPSGATSRPYGSIE